ncbi:hypothetical protein H8356DRAFT_1361466 [Neocallimastix lanati (nom. inval.)]|nr:hypothetical protein H8356DRAFT_1361466 [Neocallimastix sp. JGI-2020a]
MYLKVNTIRDLVIEVAKLFKNKVYIHYQIENEMYSETFKRLLLIVHVGLTGISSFNYFVAYLGIMLSDHVTIPIDPNLNIDTLTYFINHDDIDIIFYETNFQFIIVF